MNEIIPNIPKPVRTGLIDSVVGWSIDRYNFAQSRIKAGVPSVISSGDRALVGSFLAQRNPGDQERMGDDQMRQKAMALSWIYADIQILAQEVSGTQIRIKKMQGDESTEIKNHPAELFLLSPNPQLDYVFLWQYTIAWLMLRGNAYWFLAPEKGNEKVIAEIWPVPGDRLMAIPDNNKLIRGYAYKLPNGQIQEIPPEYIVHFMKPNPFSLISGYAPLTAAKIALETEEGTSTWQRDTYVTGRGVPHSIIALPQDTGERDFIAIASQIRDEFEQERKIIVTRSGDINVQKVGLSSREMNLVQQREFSRDEIDIIFLGIALHSKTLGRTLQEMDKMFKEKAVFPLQKLLASQLTRQFISRYYGPGIIAAFDDVRSQDRAVLVQERNVYWRVTKFNEGRQQLLMPPFENKSLPGLGDLPIPLATDPQFLMAFYGLNPKALRPDPSGAVDPKRKQPEPNAAMSNSDAPVNQLSDTAAGFKAYTSAELTGMDAEIARYKKVAHKAWKASKRTGDIIFTSDVLSKRQLSEIRGGLLDAANDEAKIAEVFEVLKAKLRGRGPGRRNKQTAAVNSYQDNLGQEYGDWADETASELAKAAPEDRDKVIGERVALLLIILIGLGRKNLPDAVSLAVGENGTSPDMVNKLLEILKENESYLEDSLIPDIRAKLQKAFNDPDIQIAIQAGEAEATDVLSAVLATLDARIESYSGAFWQLFQWTMGYTAQDAGKKILWQRDETAQHCQTCLDYGDQTYDNFDALLLKTGNITPADGTLCQTRCRCELIPVD